MRQRDARRGVLRGFGLLAVALLGIALGLTLVACDSGPQPMEIRFDARFGDDPARCDTRYDGIGAAGTTVEIGDARLYVSNLQLVRADGTTEPLVLDQETPWQHESVALLDFEDRTGRCSEVGTAEMNGIVRGSAPAGEYTGLSFDIGLPHEYNHGDATTAPSPLNVNAMYWNWQMGYIFAKFDFWVPEPPAAEAPSEAEQGGVAGEGDAAGEGVEMAMVEASEVASEEFSEESSEEEEVLGGVGVENSGVRPNIAYLAHIGSTGCVSAAPITPPSDPCAYGNRVHVELADFDANAQVVVLDLASWLQDIDVSRSVPRPPGCMADISDPDCAEVFGAAGLDLTTGECADACSGQKLVRAGTPLADPSKETPTS